MQYDLPKQAREYIEFIEQFVGVSIFSSNSKRVGAMLIVARLKLAGLAPVHHEPT